MITPPLAIPAATSAFCSGVWPVVELPDGAVGQIGLAVGRQGGEGRGDDVGEVEVGDVLLLGPVERVPEVLGLLGQGGHTELDAELRRSRGRRTAAA